MKKKVKKHVKHAPGKEDSIDVSIANAANRFRWRDVRKGVTASGGNASADVTRGEEKK